MGFYFLLNDRVAQVDRVRAARVLLAALDQETDPEFRWWLLAGLTLVARGMGAEECARTCGPVFRELAASFIRSKHNYSSYLAGTFVMIVAGLGPIFSDEINQMLLEFINMESDVYARFELAREIVLLASREGPTETAKTLVAVMERESDSKVRGQLAEGIAAVADRMGRAEAASAAKVMTKALVLERELDGVARKPLAKGIAAVAGRMAPAEAEKALTAALDRESDATVRLALTDGIVAVACRMRPVEATGMLVVALEWEEGADERHRIVTGLGSVIGRKDEIHAMRRCTLATRALLKHREIIELYETRTLDDLVVLRQSRALSRELTLLLASVRAVDADRLSALLADTGRVRVHPSEWPFPFGCRLTTQDLVDLLKMPTCIGASRRVVLGHLGNIHGRRFANHWEFVRFAREKGLKVDLTSPPKRPNREESLRRIREMLLNP